MKKQNRPEQLHPFGLRRQNMGQQNHPVGRVTYASGEQQEFADPGAYLQAIREELPYRNTTGFRYETLTDDPEVKKAVDDIVLDFAGEGNPHRACNYGLTEAGKQALRDVRDPSRLHTYSWIRAHRLQYPGGAALPGPDSGGGPPALPDSGRPEKRLGITKDGIATVDLVFSQDGEQQFFGDHRGLESFRG